MQNRKRILYLGSYGIKKSKRISEMEIENRIWKIENTPNLKWDMKRCIYRTHFK